MADHTTTATASPAAFPAADKPNKLRDRVLPNQEVRDMIEQGQVIVIQGRNVLKLDKWVERHPGGRKIIHHVVGREASSELRGFHSHDARAMMTRFCIGKLEERWQNMIPPLHRDSYHGPELPQPTIAPLEEGCEEEEEAERVSAAPAPVSTAIDINFLAAPKLRSAAATTATPESLTPESSRPPSIFSSSSDSGPLATDDVLDTPFTQLDTETQDALITKFSALADRIEGEGLYAASIFGYCKDFTRCAALLGLMLFFLRREWYFTSACFMGFFWHQIVATAHDAGHLAVTQHWTLDTIVGTIVMNFAGGLSCGWWKRNHNIHHLVPNSLSHDADVQLLPFIALSPRLFDSIYSTVAEATMEYTPFAHFMVTKQAWLYYILLSFGRFNLYFLAFEYVISELFGKKAHELTPMHRKHRILEAVGLITFWVWYGYFLVYNSVPGVFTKLMFIIVSHVVTLPLHLQLTVSHFSMSTEEGPASETWMERTLRTTMDIDAAPWMDWFHGGLQFQVTHHLFPRLPRHSLRRASELVKEYCLDIGIKYETYDFPECNGRLIRRLDEVANMANLFKECHNEVVRKGEFLHGHWE